jgi:hypothetical protein
MIEISEKMKFPRTKTSYNQNLNFISVWKAKDYFHFGIVAGPVLISILPFDQKVKQCFLKISSIFKELCSKSESKILTPKRVLELEEEFISYEKEFASIFLHVSFKPNNHRASHIFRDVLLHGRPFNFSMYSTESANSFAPAAVSGTKNPLNSIIRNYENNLFVHKVKSLLESDSFFNLNFKQTKKLLFPNLFQQEDKNYSKLTKVYFPNTAEIQFYLEPFSEQLKNKTLSNCYVQFKWKNEIKVGQITKIYKENEEKKIEIRECSQIWFKNYQNSFFFRINFTELYFEAIEEDIQQVYGHFEIRNKIILFQV